MLAYVDNLVKLFGVEMMVEVRFHRLVLCRRTVWYTGMLVFYEVLVRHINYKERKPLI
jgi:hypothetical protein